ncbi:MULTISPECIES: M23 family metallopeptidase [unclassified Sphingomonas]|uniref:M23 family metallopeptidase n=1 Tax=unclassified Sphingomonas TaxID=196159 RepID=UPI0021508394|nr:MULTISPECIES: M23 family metallopeptidase [unclassified Sphingomonas]MCR5872177.1 M23 family metallopeptidase [Sphingomonas sp. J344]UUX99511.1 M23 family metallopeptidase [Sphingomonas sp. J315]
MRIRTGLIAALMLAPLAGGCIPPGATPSARSAPAPRQVDPTAAPRREDVPALPAPVSAWEARRVTADARVIPASEYVVVSGDTLRKIADRTGAGSEAIARANNIPPPYTIRVGQRLSIPGGRYHLVRAGETGIAIARAYGVDWGRVVTENDLTEPYILRTGMRLLIPGDPRTMTLEERAAAFRLDIDDIVTGGQPAIAERARPTPPTASSARVLPPDAAVAAPTTTLRGGFAWPARGTVIRRFGPIASGERSDGIKIAVPLDTPILAAADGTVAYVGSEIPALGGLVILQHGSGWTSVYGHAGQLLVQRGQSVKRGQMIALSGDSGTNRAQLHFELRQGRTPVDPIPRLPSR